MTKRGFDHMRRRTIIGIVLRQFVFALLSLLENDNAWIIVWLPNRFGSTIMQVYELNDSVEMIR